MNERIRLIPAPLAIDFDLAETAKEDFEREYQSLNESDEDPIGQWLKIAKARGETKETDPTLLYLLVELHRKVDQLTQIVKNEEPQRVPLYHHADIDGIGFEYIKLTEPLLEARRLYYGRIAMPVFPRRNVGLWFEALDKSMAKIVRMHERDEKEWNQYVTARERVMIREMKNRGGSHG